MRYSKIFSTMWDNSDFKKLSDRSKLIYIYLCSCEHCNSIGFFKIPYGYISEDTGYSIAESKKSMDELSDSGLIRWCEDLKICKIRKYIKWNLPTQFSEKYIIGMAKNFDELPKNEFDNEFIKETDSFLISINRTKLSDLIKRSITNIQNIENENSINRNESKEMISENFKGNHIQKQEQKQEQEQNILLHDASYETDHHAEVETQNSSIPEIFVQSNDADADPDPEIQTKKQEYYDPDYPALPCKYGKLFHATTTKIEIWKKSYPGIDIKAEFLKMLAWIESNPDRIKTVRGTPRFVNNWLSGEMYKSRLQTGKQSQITIPDGAVHTEDAWNGIDGGNVSINRGNV